MSLVWVSKLGGQADAWKMKANCLVTRNVWRFHVCYDCKMNKLSSLNGKMDSHTGLQV